MFAVALVLSSSMLRRWRLGALFFVVIAAIGCRPDVNAVLESVSEARRVTDELLVQFTTAADAANRAVMSETDEGSAAFAREAKQASDAVQRDVDELRPILKSLNYSAEMGLLDEFSGRYAKYHELDQRILDLAVENTNLKAQRLAFGAGQQAADAFREALSQAMASPAQAERWHAEALAATALSALREIQVLQGPHIANADEAGMTRQEAQMAASEKAARAALESLAPLLPSSARAGVAAARTALDQFMQVNAQVVALSRRNTNVRSLALSLDQKRELISACQESLRALRAALSKRGFTGTRRSRRDEPAGSNIAFAAPAPSALERGMTAPA